MAKQSFFSKSVCSMNLDFGLKQLSMYERGWVVGYKVMCEATYVKMYIFK